MKKFTVLTALLMAAAMMITFTACGTDVPSETTTDPSTEAETETVIVQVTDANGEVVTDASGEAVTRIETVNVPTKGNNQQSGGSGSGQQTGGKDTGEKTNGTGTGGSQGGGSVSGQQGGTSGGNGGTSGGSSGGSSGGNGGSSNGGGSVTPTPRPDPKPDPKPNPAPTPTPQRTWEYLPDLSMQVFNKINAFRKQNGVPELKYDADCAAAAKKQCEWGIANSKWAEHGLSEIGTGGGMMNPGSANELVQAWIDSPGHRDSLLDSGYVYAGVAVYKDSNGNYNAIVHFDDGEEWVPLG